MIEQCDVRAIRKQLGLTQAELAEQLGCTRTHIVLVEKGTWNISKSKLLLLEMILRSKMS